MRSTKRDEWMEKKDFSFWDAEPQLCMVPLRLRVVSTLTPMADCRYAIVPAAAFNFIAAVQNDHVEDLKEPFPPLLCLYPRIHLILFHRILVFH